MLFKRRILCPWLLSAVVMFGLSYVWHGLALTDLDELPPIAPHLPEASALEAELSGLAALRELGEDSAMPENSSPVRQTTQDAE